MRAGLLIGLAMLGSVSTAHAANLQDQADCAKAAQKVYDDAKQDGSYQIFAEMKGGSEFESHGGSIGQSGPRGHTLATSPPRISTRRFDNFKPVVFDQFLAGGDTDVTGSF